MDAWCASQTLSTPHQTLDLAQNKPASPLIGLLQERTDPHLLCAQIRDHRVRLSSPPSSTSISLPVLLARLSLLPSHHVCRCHLLPACSSAWTVEQLHPPDFQLLSSLWSEQSLLRIWHDGVERPVNPIILCSEPSRAFLNPSV